MSTLKKFLISVTGIVLCAQISFTQGEYQGEIDSITILTKDENRHDTLRAQDYVDLSTYYFRQKIDTVVAVCVEGINFIRTASQKTNPTSKISLELSRANLLMNIGFTYYYLNKLDQSIEAFYESLKIAEKYDDKKVIANVRTNIANVQIDLGELNSAQENLNIVLNIQEELGDENGVGRTLNTIGYIHRINGDTDLALKNYNKALEIRLESDDRIGAAAGYNNIAFIYRINENYQLAIENYNKALKIYEEEDELTGISAVCGNLAKCYLELGETSKSWKYASQGYDLAKNQGSTKDLLYLTEILYRINKRKGNSKDALRYYEEHVILQDSAKNEKHYKELINQELQYEYQEKEKILQLEQEQELAIRELEHAKEIAISETENYRLYFSIGVVSILFLIVVVFLLFLARQKRIIERQSKELELVALRSQMNPHFLFNSLNSIKLYIIENKKELSAKYLTKFSKLVRMVLENSNKNLISLEDELEATKFYLELEQIRFKNKFEFEIINQADALIELPPLVLQPYVENAIWHGIMHKDDQGKITIRTIENDNGITIEIEDNGVGRKRAAELKSGTEDNQSMGMDITQKRIQSLHKILGVNPIIEIVDLGENNEATGTLVKITIPYHE